MGLRREFRTKPWKLSKLVAYTIPRASLLRCVGRAPSTVLAEVVLGDPLPAAEGQALRFDIWANRALLEPLGRLNRLRRRAYRASQAARPDTDGPD